MKQAGTTLLFIVMMLFVSTPMSAEEYASYKFDVGVHAGMSGYLGDANESNIFQHPGYTAGASFRYLPNGRMAVRGIFTTASLSGNTADFDD